MIKIRICLGSSCFSRGNKQYVKQVKDYLQKNKLEDRVDFRGAHCFGNCYKGPVIEIDDKIYEKINEQILSGLLDNTFNRNEYR